MRRILRRKTREGDPVVKGIEIRTIQVSDAEDFLALCHQLDEETDFLMLEPGERKTTLKQQQDSIASMISQRRGQIFLALHQKELVGYLGAFRGQYQRNAHSAYLVMGIRQSFFRRGIGMALFSELEKWAQENQVHRLELTVMAHNAAAIGLYKKMGFSVEGDKRHSLRVKGRWVDEYYMARLL